MQRTILTNLYNFPWQQLEVMVVFGRGLLRQELHLELEGSVISSKVSANIAAQRGRPWFRRRRKNGRSGSKKASSGSEEGGFERSSVDKDMSRMWQFKWACAFKGRIPRRGREMLANRELDKAMQEEAGETRSLGVELIIGTGYWFLCMGQLRWRRTLLGLRPLHFSSAWDQGSQAYWRRRWWINIFHDGENKQKEIVSR